MQARRCYFCGRQLFVIYSRCWCEDGANIHDDVLDDQLLDLLTEDGGCSKQYRALNELTRMCSLALQRGTHR